MYPPPKLMCLKVAMIIIADLKFVIFTVLLQF